MDRWTASFRHAASANRQIQVCTRYYGGTQFSKVYHNCAEPSYKSWFGLQRTSCRPHTKICSGLEAVILFGCCMLSGFLLLFFSLIWIIFPLPFIVLSNDVSFLIIVFQNGVSFKYASFNLISIPYKGVFC